MKYITGILLLAFSFYAHSSDRDDLLLAWENIQKTHKQVKSFEKVSEGKYKIKFSVLPYEGELNILEYDVEDIEYNIVKDNPFTKSGYVNVDLVGADEKMLAKYGRSYYKWFESNTLYLNTKTGKWVTSREYNKYFTNVTKDKVQNNVLFFLSDYWDYILIFVIGFFIITSFTGSRQLKKALKLQHDAVTDMEEVKRIQDVALELHKKTNKILKDILEELKSGR